MADQYHLLNVFSIRKQRIKNCIPENDDDAAHQKARDLLARRGQRYTLDEIEHLFGYLWTSHHECVNANPDDYIALEVLSANGMLESGAEAIKKLKGLKELENKKAKGLTDDQFKELAKKLGNTRANVYTVAMEDYAHKFTDDDFDKMKKVAGIFRCDHCDIWKDTSEEDKSVHDFCCECVDKL